MEDQSKKGMSKGCMVGLIVGGVLILLVIIAGVTCYMKKDALFKFGAVAITEQIRTSAVENPQPGVDTETLSALTDQFAEQLNKADSVDFEQVGIFVQTVQSIPGDDIVDSIEAKQFIGAMIALIPELGDSYWDDEQSEVDSSEVVDTVATE